MIGPRSTTPRKPRTEYHCLFVALLVTATFIDYDLFIIPDSVTVAGMVLGVSLGAFFPWIRPEPATAATFWSGLGVGIGGLLIGAGLTAFIRSTFSLIFRVEAMGFGDVTLMGMIGAFMGWRAAVLTFFLFPFFGLAHALWKGLKSVGKWLSGSKLSTSDHEIPAGPYLSMAAASLLFAWPWLWPLWAKGLFESLYALIWLMLGVDVGLPV